MAVHFGSNLTTYALAFFNALLCCLPCRCPSLWWLLHIPRKLMMMHSPWQDYPLIPSYGAQWIDTIYFSLKQWLNWWHCTLTMVRRLCSTKNSKQSKRILGELFRWFIIISMCFWKDKTKQGGWHVTPTWWDRLLMAKLSYLSTFRWIWALRWICVLMLTLRTCTAYDQMSGMHEVETACMLHTTGCWVCMNLQMCMCYIYMAGCRLVSTCCIR